MNGLPPPFGKTRSTPIPTGKENEKQPANTPIASPAVSDYALGRGLSATAIPFVPVGLRPPSTPQVRSAPERGSATPPRAPSAGEVDHSPSSGQSELSKYTPTKRRLLATVPGEYPDKSVAFAALIGAADLSQSDQNKYRKLVSSMNRTARVTYTQVIARDYERSATPSASVAHTKVLENATGQKFGGKDHATKLALNLNEIYKRTEDLAAMISHLETRRPPPTDLLQSAREMHAYFAKLGELSVLVLQEVPAGTGHDTRGRHFSEHLDRPLSDMKTFFDAYCASADTNTLAKQLFSADQITPEKASLTMTPHKLDFRTELSGQTLEKRQASASLAAQRYREEHSDTLADRFASTETASPAEPSSATKPQSQNRRRNGIR